MSLHKLGAFWAYSAAVRIMLPGAMTYDAEIRHHARKAALPEPLAPWSSRRPPPMAPRASRTTRRAPGVTKYLMSPP